MPKRASATLDDGLQLLQAATDVATEITIETLRVALRWPSEKVMRVVEELRRREWLTSEGTGGRDVSEGSLSIGPRALRFAYRTLHDVGVEEVFRPYMRQAAEASGETVTLNRFLRAEARAVIAAIAPGPRMLDYSFEVGEVKRLARGASGLAILAYLDAAGALRACRGVANLPDNLPAILKTVRKRGYAESDGQRLPGAHGLAVPLFSQPADVWGSLVITVPQHEFRVRRRPQLLLALRTAAAQIHYALGRGGAVH